MTGELHGAEEVCKTSDTGSIPALVSDAMDYALPTWLRYGAKSAHFDDVGKARRVWLQRNRHYEFGIDDMVSQLRWYEASLSAMELKCRELSIENSRLKRRGND